MIPLDFSVMRIVVLPCIFVCVLDVPNAVPNDYESSEWLRFRGPGGAGVCPTCDVPLPWSAEDVAWSNELPGEGNGSPVVFRGKIFLMSADPVQAERYLLCYDLKSGREVWRRVYSSQPHHLHQRNTYASSTPCVTDKMVYFAWGSPQAVIVKALTHDGREVWTRDLGPFVSQHGFGASPVVYGDRLILFNSQQAQQLPPGAQPGQSRVVCLDANTGQTLWETPRTTTRACYGVPALFKTETGEDALLMSNTGDGIFALRLADGAPLWNQPVFKKRCVSCPQVVADLAIATEGSGGGGNILYAVELHGDHRVRLKIDRAAPYVPCPVVRGNLLFLWSDRGIVSVVDLQTGQTLNQKRVGGNVSSSPVIAGDKLVGISEDGTVTVLSANAELKLLGSVELGETTRATPVVQPHYVLLRTSSRLLCIGKP